MSRNVKKLTYGRAPREYSDQTARSRSLIRIFTGRILDSQGCRQRTLIRLRGSFRLTHISESTFSDVAVLMLLFVFFSFPRDFIRLYMNKEQTFLKSLTLMGNRYTFRRGNYFCLPLRSLQNLLT